MYRLLGDPLFSHFKGFPVQEMSTLAILRKPRVQVLRSDFLRLAGGFDQYELTMALPSSPQNPVQAM